METIAEAKEFLRANLKKGAECPCCTQRVQMYYRKLTSSMIYALILLYKEDGENFNYIHIEEFLKKCNVSSSVRGDVPKLRFWGFIEQTEGTKEGYYRLTHEGIKFITGKTLARAQVKLYNNKFYGFHGPEIDVYVAIKQKFNLKELLEGVKAA